MQSRQLFLLLTAEVYFFPYLAALLSRNVFPGKARSDIRNSLPEAYTNILLLLCKLLRKRKLQPRHWEITVRCLSLHSYLLQARLTSHYQVREDAP